MALPSLGKSSHAIMSVLIGFHKKKKAKEDAPFCYNTFD